MAAMFCAIPSLGVVLTCVVMMFSLGRVPSNKRFDSFSIGDELVVVEKQKTNVLFVIN